MSMTTQKTVLVFFLLIWTFSISLWLYRLRLWTKANTRLERLQMRRTKQVTHTLTSNQPILWHCTHTRRHVKCKMYSIWSLHTQTLSETHAHIHTYACTHRQYINAYPANMNAFGIVFRVKRLNYRINFQFHWLLFLFLFFPENWFVEIHKYKDWKMSQIHHKQFQNFEKWKIFQLDIAFFIWNDGPTLRIILWNFSGWTKWQTIWCYGWTDFVWILEFVLQNCLSPNRSEKKERNNWRVYITITLIHTCSLTYRDVTINIKYN